MIIDHFNCKSLRPIVFMLVAFVLCGCGETGPRRHAIKGTVKLNGQPVNNATIILTPIGEGLAAAATIQNGSFELPAEVGPTTGGFNVRINPNEVEVEEVASNPHPFKANARPKIPSIYQRDGALNARVTGAPNQSLDFELKSK